MPLPDHVLVHTAVPLEYDEPQSTPAEWIEGEPGPFGGGEPVQGVPFPCVLFLPSPGGETPNQYRPRVVEVPTVLFNPARTLDRGAVPGDAPASPADGSPIALARESELLVYAPELAPWTGGEPVRWQLVGVAQPFGPPGSVIGVQAEVRQVLD